MEVKIMLWISLVSYFILAGGLDYLSDKLSGYIDLLDKKTNVSGAFLGGVLLAAVTSLPELFTSISATLFLHQKDLVVGNILGSNLFNLLVIGGCLILFSKIFINSKIEYKSHNYTFLGLAIIYGLICYGLFIPNSMQLIIGPINLICPLALIIYGLIIYFQPKEIEKIDSEGSKDISNLTIKQILTRFSIYAILLVIISIVITYVTDILGQELGLNATVAGALFLAIATSLPELVSCISLCKRNNFNAAFGDILGSCLFNFCIIGISEFLSFDGSLISQSNTDAKYMSILAIICIIAIYLLLTFKRFIFDKKEPSKNNTWFQILSIIIGIICFSGYLIFLII